MSKTARAPADACQCVWWRRSSVAARTMRTATEKASEGVEFDNTTITCNVGSVTECKERISCFLQRSNCQPLLFYRTISN